MRSIGVSEIIIILVVVLVVIIFARLKRRPRPSPRADHSHPAGGDEAPSGSARRWMITLALVVLVGLLGYYYFFVYSQI